jgi:hypothetical protein
MLKLRTYKKIAVLLAFLTFDGCASSRVYLKIDPAEKTVLIPAEDERPIIGKLKNLMRDLGWKVFVLSRADILTQGSDGKDTRLTSSAIRNARYRIFVDYRLGISFVDNKTGEEVFVVSGHPGLLNEFRAVLEKDIDSR